MHLRAGVLTALLLAGRGLAAAAYDPLPGAEGVWQGQAFNGREYFTVTATVKKAGQGVYIKCAAAGEGEVYNAEAVAFPKAGGRSVSVTLTGGLVSGFVFEVFARPRSGTELDLSSLFGSGELRFLRDFYRAELTLNSVATKITASLTRVSAPAPRKKAGSGAAKQKKAPYMAPMQIAPQ